MIGDGLGGEPEPSWVEFERSLMAAVFQVGKIDKSAPKICQAPAFPGLYLAFGKFIAMYFT
jgi:hypothetical protein